MKHIILSLILTLISTSLYAQQENEQLNQVQRLDQMQAPWGGGNIGPSDSSLMEFLATSSREIGQVANCSPKEAQIMWTCTIQIVGNWQELTKDPSFQMTKEKEQYLKNFFLSSVQNSFEIYKEKKRTKEFSCSEAAEIRRTSSMFNVCIVKEGED